MTDRPPYRIALVAGEPSGDALGAALIPALRERARGPVEFLGVAGPQMCAQGMTSLFAMSDLTLMGLAEVVPAIPKVLRRLRRTARAVEAWQPHAVVTIDAPDFCFRLAKRLHGRTAGPLIHYVAPTVWAWRPGRARRIAGRFDHLLTLLPFEPPYFQREGLAATFVGHPVAERVGPPADGGAFRERHGIAAEAPVLCVLPGSRSGEVRRLLPPFGEAVARLASRFPGLRIVIPTLGHMADRVAAAVSDWPGAPVVVGPDEKAGAFAASTVALAASGTVSLELALAGLAQVIAYRVNALSAVIARRLLVTRWVSLVNILADATVVPELLQENCTPAKLEAAVAPLLADPLARRAQIGKAAASVAKLHAPGGNASRAAADVVFGLIEERSRSA
ncbi:MAG: lipid-A-disaccharide synthase [Rhodospirillaceae bacterium]|nr:lipid-A-disaccharide synthase [Rhodospirillaceae bacterium]